MKFKDFPNNFEMYGYVIGDVSYNIIKHGRPYATFAVSNRFFSVFQEEDKYQFFLITAWDNTAKYIRENIKQGDKLYIQGYLSAEHRKFSDRGSTVVKSRYYVNTNATFVKKINKKDKEITPKQPKGEHSPEELVYREVIKEEDDVPW